MSVTSDCLRCGASFSSDEVHACPALGHKSRFVQALVDEGRGVEKPASMGRVPLMDELSRRRAVRSDAKCTTCAARLSEHGPIEASASGHAFAPPPLRKRKKNTEGASRQAGGADVQTDEGRSGLPLGTSPGTAEATDGTHSVPLGTISPLSSSQPAASALQQSDGAAGTSLPGCWLCEYGMEHTNHSDIGAPSPLPSPAAKDAPAPPAAATAVAGEGSSSIRSTLDDIGDALLDPVERLDRLPQTPVQMSRAVSALAFVPLPPLCLPDEVRDEQDAAIVADYEVERDRKVRAITEQRRRLVKQIEAAADEALLRVHNHYGALEDAKRDLAGWLRPQLKGKRRSLDLIAYRVGFRREGGEPRRTDDPEAQRALVRFCEDYYPRHVEYEPRLRWGDLKATLKAEGRVHEGRLIVEIENSSTGEVRDVAVPGVEWAPETDRFYCSMPTEKGDEE